MAKKRRNEQTYQQKQNAVDITLYDPSGETIDPVAQEEFEEAAFHVAAKHKILLSIAVT